MSLSSTMNELVIRSHQMRMHAVMEGLYSISQGNEEIHDSVIDWILDLQNIDNCLSYFINFERTINIMVNEARLENAKLNLEQRQISDLNKELQEKLDRCLMQWESQISK
jgi:uncharacterized protein YerC